jgi:hypothetical protein
MMTGANTTMMQQPAIVHHSHLVFDDPRIAPAPISSRRGASFAAARLPYRPRGTRSLVHRWGLWGTPKFAFPTGSGGRTVRLLGATILVTSLELARSEVPIRFKYLIRSELIRHERLECLGVEYGIDRRREPLGFSRHPGQGNLLDKTSSRPSSCSSGWGNGSRDRGLPKSRRRSGACATS